MSTPILAVQSQLAANCPLPDSESLLVRRGVGDRNQEHCGQDEHGLVRIWNWNFGSKTRSALHGHQDLQ